MNFAVVILAAGASSRMGRPKLLLPWGDGTVLSHLVATWRQLGAAQIAVVTAPRRDSRAGVPPAPAVIGTGQAGCLPYVCAPGDGDAAPFRVEIEGDSERRAPARRDRTDPRAVPEAGAPLDAELHRLGITPGERIENPQPELGMFSSVRRAAQWTGWRPGLTHWLLTLGDQPHVGTPTLRALLGFAAEHADMVCQPARHGRPRHPVLLPRNLFTELAGSSAENLKQFLLARPEQRACFESGDAGLDFDLDEPADYERALRGEPATKRDDP